MLVQLENIGKKFGREWIFKNINHSFSASDKVVILGGNGSGKSTLLKIISGFLSPSDGKISFSRNNEAIDINDVYKHVSYAAPYVDVYDHYTLQELINFYQKLKPLKTINTSFEEEFQLEGVKDKLIKNYSSGMRQRVKLGLSILSNCPLLLLDEPTSNLDDKGKQWYASMIEKYAVEKLIFVASNSQQEEYFFCQQRIEVEKFK
ncbi:MAG: ATP-binding cassette domain-containing protein [Bacteroidia bacterium]